MPQSYNAGVGKLGESRATKFKRFAVCTASRAGEIGKRYSAEPYRLAGSSGTAALVCLRQRGQNTLFYRVQYRCSASSRVRLTAMLRTPS